jgi:hypothetical protein
VVGGGASAASARDRFDETQEERPFPSTNRPGRILYGSHARAIEHADVLLDLRPVTPEVAGSSPIGPAKFKLSCDDFAAFVLRAPGLRRR